MATNNYAGGSNTAVILASTGSPQGIVFAPFLQKKFKRINFMDVFLNVNDVAAVSTLSLYIVALSTPAASYAELIANGIPLYSAVPITGGAAVPQGQISLNLPLFYSPQSQTPYLGLGISEASPGLTWRGYAGLRFEFDDEQ